VEDLVKFHLLVVGGTGFIGSHVIKEGVRRGWQVDSLGLNEPPAARRVAGVGYIVADITLPETLSEIAKIKYHFVVNLSGYIDHSLFSSGGRRQINTHFEGLLNLLERLDQTHLKRFVQIGSSDEYGAAKAPQCEDSREQPISPYSLAKVAGTHFLQMLHRTEGFPAVILRLFLTYGPNQDNKRFIPQIIKGCLDDQAFPTSNGEQLRDFCYIDDTVRAIYSVFECDDANGQVFNVGSGLPVSIKEVISSVCEITGKGRPQFGSLRYRPGENMALYADINKIKSVTGWMPSFSLEAGLALTVKWITHAS
jgi:nucleoside-diphosphate-sugar epimerase